MGSERRKANRNAQARTCASALLIVALLTAPAVAAAADDAEAPAEGWTRTYPRTQWDSILNFG